MFNYDVECFNVTSPLERNNPHSGGSGGALDTGFNVTSPLERNNPTGAFQHKLIGGAST